MILQILFCFVVQFLQLILRDLFLLIVKYLNSHFHLSLARQRSVHIVLHFQTLEYHYRSDIEVIEEYLDYAAKNWMTENKLAMESSMKVEMAESLLSSLKTVFEDHNIEVPEGSDSVVESLVARNDELTAELNESMKSLKALQDEVESALVESALDEACAGMADTNATKLRELSENVRYSDVDDFKTKVEGFKKSLFTEAAPVKIDVTDGGVLTEDKQAPSNVDAATQAFIDKVNSRL